MKPGARSISAERLVATTLRARVEELRFRVREIGESAA
jgi:hypothetical protein